MKSTAKPIRSTMVWGLFSGLVYLLLRIPVNSILPWPLGDQLLLWACLAGYGILLSRWASKPLSSIALPLLLLLLLAAIFIQSTRPFLFAVLGILSWLRSGICFNWTPAGKRFAAEIGLGLSTGLAVSPVFSAVTLAGALGVWLLFLIQALYFVVFEYRRELTTSVKVDPFEQAKMAAEQILSH